MMLNEKLLTKTSQEKASCLNKWQYIQGVSKKRYGNSTGCRAS